MTRNPPGSPVGGVGGGGLGGPGPRINKYDESRFLTLCEIVRQLGGRSTTNPTKEAVLADVRPKYRFKLSSADAALDSFAYLLTCSTEAHCAAVSPTWLTQRLVKLAVAWDFRDKHSSSSIREPYSPKGSSIITDSSGDTETSPDIYRDICNTAESIVRVITTYHRSTRTAQRTALESRLIKLCFRKIYSRWLRCSAFLERVITQPVFYEELSAFEQTKQQWDGIAAGAPHSNSHNKNNVLNDENDKPHQGHHHHHHNHHPRQHHPHHSSSKEDEDDTEIALRIKILEESTGKQLGYQGYFLYVLRSLQALFSDISAKHVQGKELDVKAAENTAIALDALWHLTERSPKFRHFISVQPGPDNFSEGMKPEHMGYAEPFDRGDELAGHHASRNPNFRKLAKLAAVSGAVSSVLSCKFLKRVSKTCQFDLEFISDFSIRNGGRRASMPLLPLSNRSSIINDNASVVAVKSIPRTPNGEFFERLESVCEYLLHWMHMTDAAADEALTALTVLGFNPIARNRGTHAEMLIAAHLQKLNIMKSRPYYIGTSRYPCFVCEVYISRIPSILVHRGKGETMPCCMPSVDDKMGYCNAAREFVFSKMSAVAAAELLYAMNEMKLIETPTSSGDEGGGDGEPDVEQSLFS